MLLKLRIVEGPRKGDEYLLKQSVVLGRKKGDIVLGDSKASSRHARILQNSDGMIEIEDLESTNGTFLNGKKIKKSPLKVGDRIQVGRTFLEVEDAAAPTASELDKGSWQETLDYSLDKAFKHLERLPEKKVNYLPFTPPVGLDFVQGLQAGSSVVFGFGPRSVGKICNDCLLYDELAPDIAFELLPDKEGLCVLVPKSDGVLVNNEAASKQLLRPGDRITVGHTVFAVKFLEIL